MTKPEDYLPCSARKPIVQFRRDGSKVRVQRCWEKTAEHYNSDVEPDHCAACPVREEITKRAQREAGYKPPLVAEIRPVKAAKKDTDPLPNWPACQDRNVVLIGGCCNQTMEIRVCDSVNCFRLGSEVNRSICLECPNRRE